MCTPLEFLDHRLIINGEKMGNPKSFRTFYWWNIPKAYERQLTVASENRWNISIELEQEAWDYVKELITIDVNPPKQY